MSISPKSLPTEKNKICTKCEILKLLSEFSLQESKKDGRRSHCKECTQISSAAYKLKVAEKISTSGRAYRTANAERIAIDRVARKEDLKVWYAKNRDALIAKRRFDRAKNKEKYAAIDKIRRKLQPDHYNFKSHLRRVAVRRATGLWTNLDEIRKIYADAAELQRIFGWKFNVDHVVPLKGNLVCGLHTYENLQILRDFDNKSKHNRYVDDHPFPVYDTWHSLQLTPNRRRK
jgi:hypothetical protein